NRESDAHFQACAQSLQVSTPSRRAGLSRDSRDLALLGVNRGRSCPAIPNSREDSGGDVNARDPLECPPARNRVYLKYDHTPLVEVFHQVNAGKLRSDGPGRGQCQAMRFAPKLNGLSTSSERDVRTPFVQRREPAHCTEHSALEHEGTKV